MADTGEDSSGGEKVGIRSQEDGKCINADYSGFRKTWPLSGNTKCLR